MSRVFIVIAVFLSPFVSSAEDNEGVLRVYPSPTQIGTTACREFKDEKGRLTKCIYYGMSISGNGVQSTVTYD